jgi:acetoin utilization deacetylase AcuC-like enzyme
MNSVAYISHSDCGRHDTGWGHPEHVGRLRAIPRALRNDHELFHLLDHREARHAAPDELALAHDARYVDSVRAMAEAGGGRLDADTVVSEGSWAAATAGAGAVLDAIDLAFGEGPRRSFCVVRPPGQHALRATGMGFCLFGNVAIGAHSARARHGAERVLIVDWDVHHGNGTQAVFWNDGSVLFFDTHQHPWYPGTGSPDETGEGKGRGLIVNRPFPSGAGRSEILGAFRTGLVPAAERFKPELVMISAGFDSRAGDPLGQFTLTDADFADLTTLVLEIARQHARGRVVSVLEGGYARDGLARAVGAHLDRLSA